MAFIIGLPVIQIILFCWAIGHDPTGLKLAIANYEIGTDEVQQQTCPLTKGCNYTYLSCRYLEFLKLNKSMILVSVSYSSSCLVVLLCVEDNCLQLVNSKQQCKLPQVIVFLRICYRYHRHITTQTKAPTNKCGGGKHGAL